MNNARAASGTLGTAIAYKLAIDTDPGWLVHAFPFLSKATKTQQ
jgi:hypothetical protein